jgi:hypothetical protein
LGIKDTDFGVEVWLTSHSIIIVSLKVMEDLGVGLKGIGEVDGVRGSKVGS